jgi:hypothetical protein
VGSGKGFFLWAAWMFITSLRYPPAALLWWPWLCLPHAAWPSVHTASSGLSCVCQAAVAAVASTAEPLLCAASPGFSHDSSHALTHPTCSSDHGTFLPTTHNIMTIIKQYELEGLESLVSGTAFWNEWLLIFQIITLPSFSSLISPWRAGNRGAWRQHIDVLVTVLTARRVQVTQLKEVCCSGSEKQQC